MALDARMRRQLVAARENVTTQLMQLESASLDPYSFGGSPDSRDVYAELQKELREIDGLLGTDVGGHDQEPSNGNRAYQPMATLVTTQGQWMWRLRGIATGSAAFWVIGWAAWLILSTGRIGLLPSGICLLAICLASIWAAARNRERELRLFLFTVAIGTGLVGTVMLLAELKS